MDTGSSGFEDTLELLRAAQDGKQGALSKVLELYRDRLLGRVRTMMGEEARRTMESGDVLQLTYVDVMRDLPLAELRDERAFLRWMTAIARNRIRDNVRRKREKDLVEFSEVLSKVGRSSDDSPSSAAAANEEVMRLVEGLEQLEPPMRAVIEERDLEGRGFLDVASRLSLTERQVRRLHAKALLRLGWILRRPE
jgi:RNA polymerase sigma factor (sigma-70 family)